MKIRSKKTQLVHTVTPEEWARMRVRGDASKYIIVNSGTAPAVAPAELADADYNQILKDATKAYKAKRYDDAQDLYQKANSIKPTALIQEKLAELADLLG